MGAEFIFSVISTLSGLLSTLRISGATSTEGENDIERDLNRWERLFKRIQATLYHAGEREIRDESVKLWLKEIKTVAYEAEDILDECQYDLLHRQIEESGEATSSSADGTKMKCSEGVISDEMAKKIKGVIDRFDEISRDREALSLREDDGERRDCVWTGLLPTSHMVNETAVFGRDQDKRRILDLVLSGNRRGTNHISVVSIVGMGGVGKTTLAQLVYNDPLIRCHFDMSAWVYVSPQFDVTRITKEVLESISEKVYSGLTGISAVQCALVKEIKGKKLVLVLDDVWNELPSKWEQFVEPLRVSESVRIVVTTRSKAVAQIFGTTYVHDLSCLPQDQCKLLFEHYAFGGQIIDGSSGLMEIGAQIIKKCAGLPLAIKSIARSLSCKMHGDSWRDVLESELWESDGKDEIFPALKVSYYSLPPKLKPCLLFCSLFPKGCRFLKDEIIYMWISHGYIQSRGSKSEEGIGDEYIHELDRRSFLTLDKQRWEETFTLHDLIHDLARSISMGEFCTNTRESINGVISSEVHHVYTENCSMIDRSSGSCLFIRTLINNSYCCKSDLVYNFHMDMMRHYNPKLCTNANLRVLKCEGAYAHALERMANLKHLRYFELSRSNLERLPKSTTLLFNLVALRISFLGHLKELPVHIGKLVNLRFLSITAVGIKELPESLGQLSNLQILYLCSCAQIYKLPICIGNLTNLKKLHISDAKFTKLPDSFCMLHKLQTLVLERCWNIMQLPDDIGNLINLQCIYVLGGCIRSLPKSINQLCNLDILELSTSASLSVLVMLCKRDGIFNRSSLNISIEENQVKSKHFECTKHNLEIERRNLKKYKNLQIENLDIYKYRKSESLLECLKPLNHLVELKVNGIEGIGYPKWIGTNYNSGVAIFMQCHLNSGKFFGNLGELPSLKSLTLIGKTLANDFFQILNTQDVKMIFPSLEELEFKDMIEWNILVGEQYWSFPILQNLRINNCPKLSSVPKFDSLKRLEIIKCSFSKLKLNMLHMQLLQRLHIEECIQLNSLQGLQSLYSLRNLYVVRCPQLKEFPYPRILNLPLSIEIVECPSLKSWCQHQQLNYIELEIKSCWKLETLKGLSELRLLRRLVLWDCPLLQLEKVPPFLMSLVVHGCHNMLSLDLLRLENPSFLTELEITNCKHLMRIAGLRNLTKLETLAIIQCPQLLLELLFTVPDCVVISGCPRLKAWCGMHSIEPLVLFTYLRATVLHVDYSTDMCIRGQITLQGTVGHWNENIVDSCT
ncbi:putative disease resistance protein RGA3 [Carex littledalei]|uniref:Putative disease resistance protein RGA3 n=1 Tax=Carex littledalei TaxID=544730 RepID=A0A833VHV3_9POAL|nr:putative disease resistance protein RGA3 [Carex littledalei]